MMLVVLAAVALPVRGQVCDSLALPLAEDFDGYGTGVSLMPPCWTATRNYDMGYAPHLTAAQDIDGAALVLYPGTLAESHYSMVIAPPIGGVDGLDGIWLLMRVMSATTAARLVAGLCEDTGRYTRAFVPIDTLHVEQGGRWQEVAIDLGRCQCGGRRVALRMERGLQADGSEFYVDDMRISGCGTGEPWVSHVGSDRLTLHFDTYGVGEIEVAYADTVVEGATSPLAIEGLTADADYTFGVGCASGARRTVEVHTMENTGIVPTYEVRFDEQGAVWPALWRRPLPNQPDVGGGLLRFVTAGDSCLAVLPRLAEGMAGEMAMAIEAAVGAGASLVVGVMEYAAEVSTFVPIDTLLPGVDGLRVVDFADYVGQGQYMALMAVGNGTVGVAGLRVARCMTDGLHMYNLTEDGLTVGWDTLRLAEGATLSVEYGPHGFVPGTGTTLPATVEPMDIGGLMADTEYDLYLLASCGDAPSGADRLVFHTFAHEVMPPYCANFEQDIALLQGWVCADGSWDITGDAMRGDGALRITNGRVAMPLLGSDVGEGTYLEFYGHGTGMLDIGVADNPYATVEPVVTIGSASGWGRHTVRLPDMGGRCVVLATSGQWAIDDVALRDTIVANAEVRAIGTDEATLAWQGADSVVVEYAAVDYVSGDFEPGEGVTFAATADTTLAGLQPGTHYRLHIVPADGGGTGCSYLSVGFTTLAPPLELPWCQDYDDLAAGTLPDGWRRIATAGEYPIVSNERSHSGGRSLLMVATDGGATIGVLPDAIGCGEGRSVVFWTNSLSAAARLEVGVMGDVTDAATFEPVDTINLGAVGQWQAQGARVDSLGNRHMALRLGSQGGTVRLFVDDICMDNCVAYDIRAYGIDSMGYSIGWAADDGAALRCTTHGNGQVRSDTLVVSPARVEGLDSGVAYTVVVEALCPCGEQGTAIYSGHGSSGSAAQRATSFTINTRVPPVATPYCENFEQWSAGEMPHYWRSSQAQITELNSNIGDHSLRVDAGGHFIMRQVANANAMTFSAYVYANDDALREAGAVVLGLMTDPDSANTFVPTDTLRIDAVGRWQPVVAHLGADTGQNICLRVNATQGSLFVDDISVAECAVDSAAVMGTGVVTWVGTDRAIIEYGPAGFTVGNGDIDTASSPYTIVGLDEGTAYDIYLDPVCGSGSCQRVKLELGNVRLTPYCEDFDAVPPEGIPAGWDVARTHGSTPSIAVAGTQTLKMSATVGNRSIVVMPEFAVTDIAEHELSLSMRASSAARARLLVGTIDDGLDPNTFIPHDTLSVTADNRWQRLRLSLVRHNGGRIALACEATSQSVNIWVDSVGLTRGLTPSLQAVSAHRVRVVGTGGYFVDYAPLGIPQGGGIVIHIDSSEYTMENLAAGDAYRFYVSADSGQACLPPTVLTMPTEVGLPYCHGGTTTASLVLPEPELDSIATAHLYFRLRGNSDVEVGVLHAADDWSTFVAVDTAIAQGSAWTEWHTSLAQYHGDGRFVALRTMDGGNAMIDGLMLTRCALPTYTLTTGNHLVLQGGGEVEYGSEGFVQGSGTVVSSPAMVQLADNTTYDLYLRCDSVPTCAAPRSVVTHVDHCPLPDTLYVAQPGNGVVQIGWDTSWTGFFIEYTLGDTPQGMGTVVMATAQPLTLTLAPDTIYSLYVRCDSLQSTARPPQRLRTLVAMVPVPYCNTFDGDIVGWTTLTDAATSSVDVSGGRLSVANYYGTTYLILPQPDIDSLRRLAVTLRARFTQSNGHSFALGTMSNANDPTTFDQLATFTSLGNGYVRCFHSLTDYYGNGRFIALRLQDDDELLIDELSLSTCSAYGFAMTEMESDHVVIDWHQVGDPDVSIEYGEMGFASGTGTTIHPDVHPARIDGLSPLTNYAFFVSHRCSDGCDSLFTLPSASIVDTFYTFTPQGGTGCIDYTDLHASYVTCTYGSYLNPTAEQGVVDYGFLSPQSRHTVHVDTNERDPRTEGLLRTIPEGEHASVRLGNWTSGGNASPQGESITYGMTVDAADADLLLLRYAAVLQDPEHAPSLQPRFRLEILNQDGQLIDSCGMADFIANAALGWNHAPNEVLWKDWTTVGIDLASYDGQAIFVRLTTYDCGEGSHYGYAYFTLQCARKFMSSEGCSNVPTNRFTAPQGFVYNWYSSSDEGQTISDSSSILVPSDNSITYFCRLSFVDNPTCHFTMSAFAGARYPLALFDTALSVSDCQFDLTCTNRSTISMDGVSPVGTGEGVESIRWLLPDGSESASASVSLHLPDTGNVVLSLVAGIAADQCLDTMTRTIAVRRPYPDAAVVGPAERCSNAVADTVRVHNAVSYAWADGTANSPAVVAALADTLLSCFTVDSNGCRDTLSHHLTVHPTSLVAYTDTICSSALTYVWLDTTISFAATDSAVYARLDRLDRYGCDSVMTLSLSLWPSYSTLTADTICDGGILPFRDTTLASAGIFTFADTSLHGCDSIVNIALTVMPRYWHDDVRRVCDSLRWTDGRLYVRDTIGPTDTMSTVYGCDSVLTLDLAVHPSYSVDNYVDTACAGTEYIWRAHLLPADMPLAVVTDTAIADTLRTVHGCDSVISLALTIMPMLHAGIDVEYLCPDTLYRLVAVTDAPYWRWNFGGQSVDMLPSVELNPSGPTFCSLTAGYGEHTLCAVGAMTTVDTLILPSARMRVAPQILSPERLDFEARDVGLQYAWREWYFNRTLLSTDERSVRLSATDDDDTVSVALIVGDGHCTDTALALLPIQRSHFAIPNVFTPESEANRVFSIAGFNIATFVIRIYNRRGLVVYVANDIDFEWDGRDLHGTPCPSGAYVYTIEYSTVFRPAEFHRQVGSVLLVR